MDLSERLTFEMTIILRNDQHPSGTQVRQETVQIWCGKNELPRNKAYEALDKINRELQQEGKGHEAHYSDLYKQC